MREAWKHWLCETECECGNESYLCLIISVCVQIVSRFLWGRESEKTARSKTLLCLNGAHVCPFCWAPFVCEWQHPEKLSARQWNSVYHCRCDSSHCKWKAAGRPRTSLTTAHTHTYTHVWDVSEWVTMPLFIYQNPALYLFHILFCLLISHFNLLSVFCCCSISVA